MIGGAITLLAGLTLVPALMSLFGKYLFWPTKVNGVQKKEGRFGCHHQIIQVLPEGNN